MIRRTAASAALVTVLAGPLASQTVPIRTDLVVARAESLPTQDLVEFVASHAKEGRYEPRAANSRVLTVEQVIDGRCGSVQPGYLEALRTANGKVPIELWTMATKPLVLPACLYATKAAGATTVLARQGDSQTLIAARATGVKVPKVDRSLLAKLFGRITDTLKFGQRLKIKFASAPTLLAAKDGNSTELIDGLSGFSDASAEKPEVEGTIVGPTTKDCEGTADGYPFRPSEVVAAFNLALGSRAPIPTTVGVVDNGIWSRPCFPGDCIPTVTEVSALDPFRRAFFDTETFASKGEIGPLISSRTYPINWRNRLGDPPVIDAVSGHGTHVAGLVLGGAGLSPSDRNLFAPNDRSWLKLLVMNLAPGALEFPTGTNETMFLLLRAGKVQPRIVNMSVAFDPAHSDFIPQLVEDPYYSDTLFVAAAGNDEVPLEAKPTYPAILGGTDQQNVLTVASVDATGKLSSFSSTSRYFVDLAAPGCKVSSWLAADAQPAQVSGTSQAAPLVSFAASMLSALWPNAKPVQIKGRLAYSGRLLDEKTDRDRIVSGRRLDIMAALTLRRDLVRYVDDAGTERIAVGSLGQLQGLLCEDATERKWTAIRSFARTAAGEGSMATRFGTSVQYCSAHLADTLANGTPNQFFLRKAMELDGTSFVDRADFQLPVARLRGFVLAELKRDN